MNLLLEAGGDDLRDEGDNWVLLSDPAAHETVTDALAKAGVEAVSAEISFVPDNHVKLEGKNVAAMMKLHDALEDYDDVQSVHSNFDFDESEVEALD
jgi:transcriptional/translational regulatory protein YebC/TACO1